MHWVLRVGARLVSLRHRPLLVLGLLLLIWSGWGPMNLWVNLPWVWPWYIAQFTEVQGVVEPLAPGAWHTWSYGLSPNGRTLFVAWRPQHEWQHVLYDTVTGDAVILPITDVVEAQWLDNRYILFYDSKETYALLDSTLASTTSLVIYPKDKYKHLNGAPILEAIFRKSSAMYVLGFFGRHSSVKVVAFADDQIMFFEPDFADFGWKGFPELAAWLRQFPHEDLTPEGFTTPKLVQLRHFSHDGTLYSTHDAPLASWRSFTPFDHTLLIADTRTDMVVARVFKRNWQPRDIGWDVNNEWFYFTLISGRGSSPERPFYRVRPWTAEEAAAAQRQARLWQAAQWGGATLLGGALAAAAWRHARRTSASPSSGGVARGDGATRAFHRAEWR